MKGASHGNSWLKPRRMDLMGRSQVALQDNPCAAMTTLPNITERMLPVRVLVREQPLGGRQGS